jgi:hypothetical protein
MVAMSLANEHRTPDVIPLGAGPFGTDRDRRLIVGSEGLWLERGRADNGQHWPFPWVLRIQRRPPESMHVLGTGSWWSVELRLTTQQIVQIPTTWVGWEADASQGDRVGDIVMLRLHRWLVPLGWLPHLGSLIAPDREDASDLWSAERRLLGTLARSGAPMNELKALVLDLQPYRGVAVDSGMLARILEDSTAAPVARALAAVALRLAGVPNAQARLRVVAQEMAHPRFRSVLLRVAEAREEAKLQRAIGELQHLQGLIVRHLR